MKKILAFIFTLASALSIYGQGSMRTVQTLDQLLAINPAAVGVGSSVTNTVYSVMARNSSLPYASARAFRNWRGTPYSTNIANVYPAVDGTQWVADDRTAPIQDSTWWTYFNNSADSTAALQAAINFQPKVLALMTDATITQLLVTNAITFQGYGITLYQFTNGIATNFIQVASNTVNVRFQGITFDGRNQAARCLRVDRNTVGALEQVTFKNFQEFNTPGKIMACAFYVNGGDTYWTIDDSIFQDITGLPDGVIGSGTGFSHGAYINREFGSASGINKPTGVLFTRCRFYRILPGEDSDAIRWTDSGWTYQDSQISAELCYFEDIGKRAFKASGSGGRFVNNTITNSFDGSFQATGWFDVNNYKEQYSVVSLYGRNHVVQGNKFNGGRIRHFFDTTVEAGNVDIGNNIFTLSTNWGLNGTVSTNSGFGTMFGSIYTSNDIKVHDNIADAVQFGIEVFSASTNISLTGNQFRNPVGLTTYAGTGWGRGIRLGRYGTAPPYVAGPVYKATIANNKFFGFAGDIDLSETIGTHIAGNTGSGSSLNLIINATDPDGNSYPADVQIDGGIYGAIELLRPIKLWATNSDVVNTEWASQTNFHRRGEMLYDTKYHGLATYDGRKFVSTFGSTKKYQAGGITTNTWYRVASAKTTGYGNRGSARVTIGAGGGLSTASSTFDITVNYSDAQILMSKGFAYTSGSNMPISAVRVIRDSGNSVMYFDFQPSAPLTSLVAVEVQPDWSTLAGMETTNAWEAVQFTDVGTSLSGGQVQTAAISNVTSKVFAYNGDQWNWWFGPDKFVLGEGPLARFSVSNSVPTTAHTPVFLLVDGAMNQMMRDATSGVFYASTYKQPHQVIGWGMGLTNSGTNVSVSLAAGTNITITSLGNTYVINSSAASSVTYTNGVTNSAGVVSGTYLPGANVTFTTNGSSITIASTGGGSGPTNGSAVYVKGTGVTTINLIASGELDPTYSGTNLTYGIVANSIATNKIDSTFYAWINAKQSALSFTNGITNSAGTVQLALLAGSNITLSTNAGAVTISSTGGGGATNGSAVFVDAVYQSAPNFADSSELNVTVSGTNATYSIIANSIATNKIDSTFYNFINNKQSALSFSTGTTNSNGTVTAALAPGSNVTFTTNANTITIASTGGGGGGGLGTNLFVNNVLSQPAKLTNSTTITWSTNSNGDIVANAAPGAATGVFFASSKLVTVASTNTTETSIIGAVRAGETTTLPANSLYNGAVLRITASGLATATGNWDNNTIKVKIGSAVLTSHWRDTASVTFTGSPWSVIAYLTMYTNGASAVYGLSGKLEYVALDQVGGAEPPFVNTEIPTISGSLDTTTANTIDITFQNNAGNAFDSFDCRTVIAEFLPMGSGGTSGSGTYVTSLAVTNFAPTQYISWNVTNNVAYPVLTEPNKFYDYYDDLNWVALPTTGPIFTTANGAGAGASIVASETNACGIVRLSTGTTATGNNRLQHGATATDAIVFGTNNFSKCETRLRLPALSNGTDRYIARACFYDAASGNATDGAYFEYSDNVNSGNWVGKVYSNSSLQSTNLTVGPAAATWSKLEVQVDGYLGYAYFFVDGTLQATITTGIPLGAARGTGVRCVIESTVGANADLMEIDYLHVEQFYTPAR